jgi:peptidoglycan/xylan/chitin deacetylase (PgdA/CDA1 family)
MVNEQPIVSFTFDDFPKTAVSQAAPILERLGLAGTYYLSRNFCGATADGMAYYDLSDLKRLIDNGHEIGCHTASHLHVSQATRAELAADLKTNADFLRAHFGDVRMSTFAFPFGDIDMGSKLLVQARFAACRTTKPGVNRRVADLGALRAERLYAHQASPETISALVTQAASPRSWLIFYTHDVSDSPSPFGCTPALFESAVNSALEAGCRVLTVRNALGPIRFRG